MSYQEVATCSQIVAMVIFAAVMACVLVYALKPGNRSKFDAAARVPLMLDDDEPGGRARGLSILRDEDEEGQSNGRT